MKRKAYKAYLIRCWHSEQESQPSNKGWRFSLEPVDGEGRKHGFTNPQDLLTFLTRQIESSEIELTYETAP